MRFELNNIKILTEVVNYKTLKSFVEISVRYLSVYITGRIETVVLCSKIHSTQNSKVQVSLTLVKHT